MLKKMQQTALAISIFFGGAAEVLAEEVPKKEVREVEVIVEGAYKPNKITVPAGEPVRIRFLRKDYTPCTKEVVFPALNIRRELPTNQPVVVELGPLAPGEYEFKCGMNMVRGSLVVKADG